VAGLPEGVQRLLELALAVPEKSDARRGEGDISILASIGQSAIGAGAEIRSTVSFIGEVVIAHARVFSGRGIFRWKDFLTFVQRAGVEALGISVLVATLLGLILAFISAVQFAQYGAEIYVADLVAVGMVRDLGALITAIVMAGRSGAAYAAEIGSMRGTQEIDALETAGISPIEFLVVPRILALALMLPLLTVFADLAGILGGAVVGVGLLDISPVLYFEETVQAVKTAHLFGGLIKGFSYGILVGVAGCLRGIQSGSSSLAVGAAATSAVVTGLVWLIVTCGLFQVLQYFLQIP
jgi:phospholipid/cholesterol/gamma-HCH transport system permease protein